MSHASVASCHKLKCTTRVRNIGLSIALGRVQEFISWFRGICVAQYVLGFFLCSVSSTHCLHFFGSFSDW